MLARMSMSIEKFRESAARRRAGKGRGARYPEAARAWAVQYAEGRLRRRGCSVAAVARDLGISDMTLRGWLYDATVQRGGPLCEVVIDETDAPPPKPTRPLTVTTAQGHTVTGLDLEGAASLLKALG